jgi:1,2-phenylacetyl-CoA epoxidase PaaB subunit
VAAPGDRAGPDSRSEPAEPDRTEVWEVFARHDDEARTHHVGAVRAAGPQDARVFAFMMYDERKWRELFVIPRADLVHLVTPE